MSNLRKKVLVAMSGGVDSSLSGVLLLEKGWEVAGVTMILGKGSTFLTREPLRMPDKFVVFFLFPIMW